MIVNLGQDVFEKGIKDIFKSALMDRGTISHRERLCRGDWESKVCAGFVVEFSRGECEEPRGLSRLKFE